VTVYVPVHGSCIHPWFCGKCTASVLIIDDNVSLGMVPRPLCTTVLAHVQCIAMCIAGSQRLPQYTHTCRNFQNIVTVYNLAIFCVTVDPLVHKYSYSYVYIIVT
jgi:hypothetical protein